MPTTPVLHESNHKAVQRFADRGPNGGAYYNIYTREDGSRYTIEFTASGAHLQVYEGTPRDLSADKPSGPVVNPPSIPPKPPGPPPAPPPEPAKK